MRNLWKVLVHTAMPYVEAWPNGTTQCKKVENICNYLITCDCHSVLALLADELRLVLYLVRVRKDHFGYKSQPETEIAF